jgi:hypothetical protein
MNELTVHKLYFFVKHLTQGTRINFNTHFHQFIDLVHRKAPDLFIERV